MARPSLAALIKMSVPASAACPRSPGEEAPRSQPHARNNAKHPHTGVPVLAGLHAPTALLPHRSHPRRPEAARLIGPILGHSATGTAERHYIQAYNIEASRAYGQVLRGLRGKR